MKAAETFVDVYINAQILVFFGFTLWWVLKKTVAQTPLGRAFGLQLGLLNSLFLLALIAPLVSISFQFIQSFGVIPELNMTASDIAISYYLKGNIDITATRFESYLATLETFRYDLLNTTGGISKGIILLVGFSFLVGVGRLCWSMVCLRSIIQNSYCWRRIGRVHVVISDTISVPFSTRGFRSFYIVLPTSILENSRDMRVAVAHEIEHIRYGDLEWEVLFEFAKPLFILNPFYYAYKRHLENLREHHCDMRVLSRGQICLRDYCHALLSVCENKIRQDRLFAVAMPKVPLVTADQYPATGKPSLLESRLKLIVSHKTWRINKLTVAVTGLPMLMMVMICILLGQPRSDWSHDRIMLSTLANLERLQSHAHSGLGQN